MGKVHLFPTIPGLLPGFRLPLQYIGDGEDPVASQVEDTVLLAWVEANMTPSKISVQTATVSDDGSVAVAANRLVSKVVVIGSAPGTFDLGTTIGGTQILEGESFDTDGAVYVIERFFASSGSLYFGGGFSGSITVKLVLINLT